MYSSGPSKHRGKFIASVFLVIFAGVLVLLAFVIRPDRTANQDYKQFQTLSQASNYNPTLPPLSTKTPAASRPLGTQPTPAATPIAYIEEDDSAPAAVDLGDYSKDALKQILSNELVKSTGSDFSNVQINVTDLRYNPIAPPSISFSVFQQVLAQGHSPALPEAASMYAVCLREYCDPALALAFFDKESSLGLYGVAAQTRSLGNIRCKTTTSCLTTDGNGSFQMYASWTEGMQAWAVLLRDTYLGKWKLATLEQILPRYAPGEQSIDYIKAVKVKVDNLRLRGRLR